MKPGQAAVILICLVICIITLSFVETGARARAEAAPPPAPPPGVREFTLIDGSHCVGGYGVGLVCDWKR